MARPRVPMVARFWAMVSEQGDCWIWGGALDRDGYGRIGLPGGHSKYIRSHRFSWLIHYGPIPTQMCVLHRCDNPSCVRPDHLWLGTTADNQTDMMAKRRSTHGDRSARARLNKAQVLSVLEMLADDVPGATIARHFAVSASAISAIKRCRTWRYVGIEKLA